jgi:hypothetical protein
MLSFMLCPITVGLKMMLCGEDVGVNSYYCGVEKMLMLMCPLTLG